MINNFLIAFLVIIILLLAVYIYLKRVANKNKVLAEQKAKEQAMANSIGLNKIPNNPRESLMHLNRLARLFFSKYLKEKHQETYNEIEDALKKKNEKEMVQFCEDMNYLLYSGKETKKEDSLRMINKFNGIIKSKSLTIKEKF